MIIIYERLTCVHIDFGLVLRLQNGEKSEGTAVDSSWYERHVFSLHRTFSVMEGISWRLGRLQRCKSNE